MSRRTEIYVLVALFAVLGVVLYRMNQSSTATGAGGAQAFDGKFQPLDIQAPQLHLDQLARLKKLEYTGSHRNIFVATPPPPPPKPAGPQSEQAGFVGPRQPPPPPPLEIPAVFFGYATRSHGGRRVAFFTSGDDVLIVAEGDTFLGQYRLVHIDNESADVEEVSTGRHTRVPLIEPPPDQASNQ